MVERSSHYNPIKLNSSEFRRCDHERRLVERLVKKFGLQPFGITSNEAVIASTNPRRDKTPDVVVLSGKDSLGRPKEIYMIEIVEFFYNSKEEGVLNMLKRTKLKPGVDYGKDTILLIGLFTYIREPEKLIMQISDSLLRYNQYLKNNMPIYIYHEREGNTVFAQVHPNFEVMNCLDN